MTVPTNAAAPGPQLKFFQPAGWVSSSTIPSPMSVFRTPTNKNFKNFISKNDLSLSILLLVVLVLKI